MTNEQIMAQIQSIIAARDAVTQEFQDKINVLLRGANLYVDAQNAHIETLKGFLNLKAESNDRSEPSA